MLIYGRNPVLEAIRQGTTQQVWVARGVEAWLLRELDKLGVPYQLVPRIEMDTRLKTTHHQGLAAEVMEARYADPQAPLELARSRNQQPLLVLLDGITDPRNYGAIIRSAVALGAHGVITEERRSAPLSALTLKAAAGMTAKIPLVQVKNLARYIDQLKQEGLWVYGASGHRGQPAQKMDYRRPLALVIGSEGEGLRRLVAEKCDELVQIPLEAEAESLNAGVALAILLYQTRLNRADLHMLP